MNGLSPKPQYSHTLNMLLIEGAEDAKHNGKLARAAERQSAAVDRETVALFRKYGLPLPDRLAKTEWAE